MTQPGDWVIVLGCPPRPDGSTSAMQRWRVDRAVASLRPDSWLLFTGHRGEATTMATDAIARRGADADRIVLETTARSTWENLGCSAALIPVDATVCLVSDPVHTRRACRYWTRRFPDRAGCLRPAARWRGEHPILFARAVAYALVVRVIRYRPHG